jgi:hypothetical protein
VVVVVWRRELWARVIVHDAALGILFLAFFGEDGGDESISGGGR